MFDDPYGILKLNSEKTFYMNRRLNKKNSHINMTEASKKACECNSATLFKYWENDPYDYIHVTIVFWNNNLNKLTLN